MNVLPSTRLLALVAAAAVLFLVDTRLALAANGVLLACAVVDVVGAPRRGALRVTRRAPARVALGAEAELVIEAESTGDRPLRLRITDDLPPALLREGDDVFERVVAPRRGVRVVYRVRAASRGVAVVGDVHLRALGSLGLVWRQWRVPMQDVVQVQPGVREVRRHRTLAQRHRLRDAGLRVVRERGEGSSFESLRDYIPGDDPRHVDWKATARRGTMTVRQYEAERSQNVMLAIDAGRLMTERIDARDRLDHALSAALLLADVATLHGDRVGIFVFADRVQQYLPPRRAPLSRLAEAFTRVEARLAEPDYPGAFAYLSRNLRRRSLLVLFTDVIDPRASAALLAHLNAATRRHLPLAMTLRNTALEGAASRAAETEADVFHRAAAEELLQARAHALAAMTRAGVLVADVRPADTSPAVINRYLEVKRRGLL